MNYLFSKRIENLKLSDLGGKELKLFNKSMSGGINLSYKRDNSPYSSKTVYISGAPCTVSERKLGGFTFKAQSSKIYIQLNYKYWLTMIVLGILSLGIVPILFKFLVRSKYPCELNDSGLTLANGKTLRWADLSRVEQAKLMFWTFQVDAGALELYFHEEETVYVIIPLGYIRKVDLVVAFLDEIFHQQNKRVIYKKSRLGGKI